jgi:hypothetical protein
MKRRLLLTAINYIVTFVNTTATCTVTSFDVLDAAVIGADNSSTTYLKVAYVYPDLRKTKHKIYL